jgi:hypothetical protein
MKQCIALAGLACLLASGCAHSGMLGKKKCCESCQVARSQHAPRPKITRDFRPSAGLGIEKVSYNGDASCGACDSCPGCGCPADSCCCEGCNGQGCDQCGGGECGRMAERVANGFCGCGPGRGICPNAGGYPEATGFNQGPPVGQVAYPYYTVRGPRDFLRDKPPTIGPY